MYARAVVKRQMDRTVYEVEYDDKMAPYKTMVNIRHMFSVNTYNDDNGVNNGILPIQFDDMNEMNLLNEAEIIYNLKHRY